jgi:hypothetical protein
MIVVVIGKLAAGYTYARARGRRAWVVAHGTSYLLNGNNFLA